MIGLGKGSVTDVTQTCIVDCQGEWMKSTVKLMGVQALFVDLTIFFYFVFVLWNLKEVDLWIVQRNVNKSLFSLEILSRSDG